MIRLVLFLSIMLLSTIMPDAARAQQQLHIAILGDSNTWLGGDECDNQKGWNKWFKDILQPASCRSYARSGATWTHTTKTKRDTKENIGKLGKDNVIFNQVMRLKEAYDRGEQHKPDLILIAAGTNDAWFKKERPYAFNKDADDVFSESSKDFRKNDIDEILTLAEAVRYDCEWLSHFFPEAQIILLSPLQTTAAPTELIHQAGDIIEECGRSHAREGDIQIYIRRYAHQRGGCQAQRLLHSPSGEIDVVLLVLKVLKVLKDPKVLNS